MTKQQRKEAIEYIEGQLESGYIDLGFHDQNELETVQEAINLLKTVDEFNNIGCTSWFLVPEQDKPIKVVCDDGRINVTGGENIVRIGQDLYSPTIKASELAAFDCSHMSDEEFEKLCKELELEND